MKRRHYDTRFKQLEILANSSTCKRRGVAAMCIDEETNTILIDGYNGTSPGENNSCHPTDNSHCLRTLNHIKSGQDYHIGCYHAERSCIFRAAYQGISLKGSTMLITAPPCIECAKAISRVGIAKVIYKYADWIDLSGIHHLNELKIKTEYYNES